MEYQSTKKTGNNIYGDNIRCMLNKYRPIDDEDNEWSPLVATDVCAAIAFFVFVDATFKTLEH